MIEEERVVSSRLQAGDAPLEAGLRPQSLDDFPGQERVKEKLSIYIQAARERGDALDHVLLYGPPAGQDVPGPGHRPGAGRGLPDDLRSCHRAGR